MEQDKMPCAGSASDIKTLDRETFERVWRRVMPNDRPDCPIELRGLRPAPPPPPAQPLMGAWSPETATAAVRTPPRTGLGLPAPAAVTVVDLPENDVPRLGAASAVYGSLLQDFITDEITDHKTYQYMSRRARGGAVQALAALAADELSHARRLSAAYFLISGVRFWPDRLPAVPVETWLGGLRQRYIGEQQGELSYRAAAGTTADNALRELYLDLAADEQRHAEAVRRLLESM